MTKQPHNLHNNPHPIPQGTATEPATDRNRAPRKQRIRGCGVPPTVWFTPHPDSSSHDARKENNSSAWPEDQGASRREFRPWAVAEMVRQFTAVDGHYAIIRARLNGPGGLPDGAITRRRRATAEGDLSGDTATTIRAGYDLVIVVGSDDEFPREETNSHDEFAADENREPRDWSAPVPEPLTVLIQGAKRMLGHDGILAVQLPRPTPGPRFNDGTGEVIKNARRAGFTYLQHIALVDSFIDHDGLTPLVPQTDLDAFWTARSQGLTVHARAHSDLLIFRKPEKETALA
jgi:hypothetical protein